MSVSIDELTIGERIRIYRNKKGISALQMSKKLGYTQTAVSLWETNKFLPSLISLLDICEFLDVSPNELLGWKGNK